MTDQDLHPVYRDDVLAIAERADELMRELLGIADRVYSEPERRDRLALIDACWRLAKQEAEKGLPSLLRRQAC